MTLHRTAEMWKNKLGLQPHPEGGYFQESYRCGERILQSGLPERYDGERSVATSIYFLLEGRQVSSLHRLKSDELWHFYDGSSLTITVINEAKEISRIKLGLNAEIGERPFFAIPHGSWFGAEVDDKNAFSLIGCTVAPGFEFSDFELADKEQFLKIFPEAGIEHLLL